MRREVQVAPAINIINFSVAIKDIKKEDFTWNLT